MTFKEILQKDIKNVFLNLNEFAEIHDLNGFKVAAVIDDDFLDEITLKISGEQQSKAPGLFGGTIAIYVAKSDFGKLKPGRALEVDGKLHKVISTSEEDGMLKIVATRTGG